MRTGAISFPKINESQINEDAVRVGEKLIAVSDGAGGGGVFADLWSKYLVNHLPDTSLNTFDKLDTWLSQIWETFYDECEIKAKQEGGMLLDKFYEEGSFATLSAIWMVSNRKCHWIAYGDSVAFHYNFDTKRLVHSFSALKDFASPPSLINCKDELSSEGFRTGIFNINKQSVVFVASDAVAHYILSLYELAHRNEYEQELQDAKNQPSKIASLIKSIENSIKTIDFNRKLTVLLNNGEQHLRNAFAKGYLGHDDCSFAFMDLRAVK